MKRIIVPVVVAIALALPAQAVAKTKTYTGKADPSGDVVFKLKKKKHKKPKVKDFTFLSVPITCAEGTATTSGKLNFSVKVKNGDFTAVGERADGSASVFGHVSGGNASGTLQVLGAAPIDNDGTGTNCDTGKLSWSATKG